jgi:hypothetical protein
MLAKEAELTPGLIKVTWAEYYASLEALRGILLEECNSKRKTLCAE